MAKKHYASMRKGEMYASREQAHALRNEDSGMIREDKSAACLLPTGVIEKQWASGNYSGPTGVTDLYTGVQKRLDRDRSDLMRSRGDGVYY